MTRLLLAEDDVQIVQSLKPFLHDEGFDVTAVIGRRAALTVLEKGALRPCLPGISLPEGSGLDVCRAIRDFPVVFLTASVDENSVVTGLDLGADDYIVNLFRARDLVSRLRSVLRRSGGSPRSSETHRSETPNGR